MHALAAEHSVRFLDAPVSGGQAGAESGQLTVMVGGDEDVFARAVACHGLLRQGDDVNWGRR